MQAVAGVLFAVGQVDERRLADVVVREPRVPRLGGHDGLRARRQRRVPTVIRS